jgi:ParB family chromosome partitioning protein
VPAIVRVTSGGREKLELAIIENIQRADLNPIETARAFAKLQDEFKLTQREIAARLGKSREVVANGVRLLNLPSEIQESISGGRVSESQARLLLSIDDISSQRKLFEEILKSNLSVREVKSRIQEINSPTTISPKLASVNPETDYLKERLEDFLGTKIDLSRAGDGGKITISFYSEEELKAITEKLLKNPTQNDTQSL